MYFARRLQAGRMLGVQLAKKYRDKNCVVVALSDGGAMVGAQIAKQLHCVLTMLLSEEINLPREEEAIGAITSEGNMAYNTAYSTGEIDEIVGEYRTMIEEQKLIKLHKMNQVLTKGKLINRELLLAHNVILVSDGFRSSFMLETALEFLKPIEIQKLIVATPLASLAAVDWMHISADEIYCLSVVEDYISTQHYYDEKDIPDHQIVIKTIEDIILHWQ
jgi:putative phosphoribosyl transferase